MTTITIEDLDEITNVTDADSQEIQEIEILQEIDNNGFILAYGSN